MGRNQPERKDSLSSSSSSDDDGEDNSLSLSMSMSSQENNKKNNNNKQSGGGQTSVGQARKRLSSDSLSSDDKDKNKRDHKKTNKDKDKDQKKDKKKDSKKDKKIKKKISKEDKKDKKKKKKKSNKDKKSKKENKDKKSKKESSKKSSKQDNKEKDNIVKKKKDQFGKYGIIGREHIYEKRDEFQQWLGDVKQMNIEVIGQNEEKRLFDDYIEDYNTASMPEKKYYDLALWDQYLKAKQMGKGLKKQEDLNLNDEALKQIERERQRQQYETRATAAALSDIYTHRNMALEIQETQAKTAMMQQSYKIGDIDKALDLQKELIPEKKKPGQQ